MLYHGTKVSPNEVLITGLKPTDIKQTINNVVEKYSFRGQLKCKFKKRILEYVQAKLKHLYVYLTDDFNTAVSYAKYGSNFIGLLEIEACDLLGKTWKPNRIGYVYFVNLQGKDEVKVTYVHPKLITGWVKIDFSLEL